MSAIFGIIYKKRVPGDTAAKRMKEAMQHRIAGGYGEWQQENVFLGNCLSIHTPEDQYEQLPLERENLVITADVRLDNRPQLIGALNLANGDDSRIPDSLLILLSYRKWGRSCVDYLEGEFAFGIWDKNKRELFLATDAIGFRPVFYFDNDDVFVFASEQKGVLAGKNTPHVFNERAIVEYFKRGGTPGQTYTRDVYILEGGHLLQLVSGKLSEHNYWQLTRKGKYRFRKDEDWTDCLREILGTLVTNRLRTEKNIGITLSGGLDSGSLACLLAAELAKKNQPLYAFSSVLPADYAGPLTDERKYIETIGRKYSNILQTWVDTSQRSAYSTLGKAVDIDEQIPNLFYYVDHGILEAAQEKQIGALFNGFGGDFWVSNSGNDVIKNMFLHGSWGKALRHIRQFAQREKRPVWKVAMRELIMEIPFVNRYRHFRGKPYECKSLMTPSFLQRNPDTGSLFQFNNITALNIAVQTSGIASYALYTFGVRNAHYGMTAETPLFSKELYEFLMDAPPHLFINHGYRRSFLRHAMQDILPAEIQWRTDKKPYVPGYASRYGEIKDLIMNDITDEKNSRFDHVFQYDVLQKRLALIPQQVAMGINPDYYAVMAGAILAGMHHMRQNGYLFTTP